MIDSVTALLADIQQHELPDSVRDLVPLIAAAFMGLEYFLARLALHDTHDMKEKAASLGIALGNAVLRSIESGAVALPFVIVYRHRLFDIPLASAPAFAALLLGTEFFYYWHHRASHRIRWMWATHAVHHSPNRLNYKAANHV